MVFRLLVLRLAIRHDCLLQRPYAGVTKDCGCGNEAAILLGQRRDTLAVAVCFSGRSSKCHAGRQLKYRAVTVGTPFVGRPVERPRFIENQTVIGIDSIIAGKAVEYGLGPDAIRLSGRRQFEYRAMIKSAAEKGGFVERPRFVENQIAIRGRTFGAADISRAIKRA